MLIEMSSPVFIEKGKVRPPIRFKEGLNVILGKEDGENSIGKSSAMLAIDFVFGGNSYLSGDGVKHIGDHTIFFAYLFDGKKHYFARNTSDPSNVFICTEAYELTGVVWTKDEFCDWLKAKYHIDFSGLSFRVTLSSFFRVYGKENTDERKPLHGTPGQNMQGAIEMLVKLFDRYQEIESFTQRQTDQKKRLEAFRSARNFNFIPSMVGGKTQYEENVVLIGELEQQMATLTVEQADAYTNEDIEKSRMKAQLVGDRIRLETDIQFLQRRLKLVDMSLECGLYPTEADFDSLQRFFPDVNLRKLYEVEKYHQKLARILDEQFTVERDSIEGEIAELQERVHAIQEQISSMGFVGNISKEFLDKHSEIKGRIDALKAQNAAYLTLTELQDAKKRADELLRSAIESILADIQREMNDKMKEFNDTLFTEPRKAPRLVFSAYNSYRFDTPDDTGTGSNYKGMVIYDLSVLFLTALPAIAHDSLILKNIGDGAIDGIMRIYSQSTKQIFIAFDKQDAYTPATQQIIVDNTVLRLSDHNCELYGQAWNKEEKTENADEL